VISVVFTLLGHTFIDILKIDIEGGEFDALTSFVATHAQGLLPVGQLQLEVHAREGHERFDYFVKWWASLEAAGLRPFWTEANMVYINIVRGAAPELAEVCLYPEMWKNRVDRMFFEVLIYEHPRRSRAC
jgi:hypothetical protein